MKGETMREHQPSARTEHAHNRASTWHPTSIYRVLVDERFTLDDAAQLVPQIVELGFTSIRISPITNGSTANGAGAPTDPNVIDPRLGGTDGLSALSQAAHAASLGVIVDVVPGALDISHPGLNPYWWDVLSNGQQSVYADWFDIQWTDGKVTVVADQPPTSANLATHPHTGQPVLQIGSTFYPVAPGTLTDSPHDTLAQQHYVCLDAQQPHRATNYRRVNADSRVATIRADDPRVFAETHHELARWFRDGLVDGVSVRYIDSIADPQAYLDQLLDLTGGFIITEKRFAFSPSGEREVTPASWPGSASTTYPLIATIDGALTHPYGFYELEAFRQHLVAGLDPDDRAEVPTTAKQLRYYPTAVTGLLRQEEVNSKQETTATRMRDEMVDLALTTKRAWQALDEPTRNLIATDPSRDTDVDTLANIFVILAASVPVARPELGLNDDLNLIRDGFLSALSESTTDDFLGRNSTGETPVMTAGSMVVARALAKVRSTLPTAVASDRLMAYIGLLLTTPKHPVSTLFSQTTSDVLNLGVTENAHYRYCALAALNEVGGLPSEPGHPDRIFDEFTLQATATSAPVVNALTSPVTKYSRAERCRILALSEIPQQFAEFIARMRKLAPLAYPDQPNTSFDILLWQSIVGSWNPDMNIDRVTSRAVRAATRLRSTDDRFIDSVRAAVHIATTVPEAVATIEHMVARVRDAGNRNSAVARALQLFAPGIPEVFDPLHTSLQDRLDSGNLSDPVLRHGLELRYRNRHIFDHPTAPSRVAFTGERAAHAIGLTYFGKSLVPDVVLVAERLPITLHATGGWHDTRFHIPTSVNDATPVHNTAPQHVPEPSLQTMALPVLQNVTEHTWRDALTGATWTGLDFSLAQVLGDRPVALLERVS